MSRKNVFLEEVNQNFKPISYIKAQSSNDVPNLLISNHNAERKKEKRQSQVLIDEESAKDYLNRKFNSKVKFFKFRPKLDMNMRIIQTPRKIPRKVLNKQFTINISDNKIKIDNIDKTKKLKKRSTFDFNSIDLHKKQNELEEMVEKDQKITCNKSSSDSPSSSSKSIDLEQIDEIMEEHRHTNTISNHTISDKGTCHSDAIYDPETFKHEINQSDDELPGLLVIKKDQLKPKREKSEVIVKKRNENIIHSIKKQQEFNQEKLTVRTLSKTKLNWSYSMLMRDKIYSEIFHKEEFQSKQSDTKPLYLNKQTEFCQELIAYNKIGQILPELIQNKLYSKIDLEEYFSQEEAREIHFQFISHKTIYNNILTKIVSKRPLSQIQCLLKQQIAENLFTALSTDKNYQKQIQYLIDTVKQINYYPLSDKDQQIIFEDKLNERNLYLNLNPDTNNLQLDTNSKCMFTLKECKNTIFTQFLDCTFNNEVDNSQNDKYNTSNTILNSSETVIFNMNKNFVNLKKEFISNTVSPCTRLNISMFNSKLISQPMFNIEQLYEEDLQQIILNKNNSVKREEWTVLAYNRVQLLWEEKFLQDLMFFESEQQIFSFKLLNRKLQKMHKIQSTFNVHDRNNWCDLNIALDQHLVSNFVKCSQNLQSSKILKFNFDQLNLKEFYQIVIDMFRDRSQYNKFTFRIQAGLIARQVLRDYFKETKIDTNGDGLMSFIFSFQEKISNRSFTPYESILIQTLIKFMPITQIKLQFVELVMTNYKIYFDFPKITVYENILKHKIFNLAYSINENTTLNKQFQNNLNNEILEMAMNREKSFLVENMITQGLEDFQQFISLQFIQPDWLLNAQQNDPLQIIYSDPIGNQVLNTLIVFTSQLASSSEKQYQIYNAIAYKIGQYQNQQFKYQNIKFAKNIYTTQCTNYKNNNPQDQNYAEHIKQEQLQFLM